ncbi:MAG TPA: HAD-IA family hydrolase [Opitutaceae bacterium]
MIRALAFDFDGFLLDTDTALIAAYGDVHRAHSRIFDREAFNRAIGTIGQTFNPWKGFGPAAPRSMLEREFHKFHQARLAKIDVMPGVRELIDEARKRGLFTGCATNSPRAVVQTYLKAFGLFERIDHLVCREDAAAPKPAPDLYATLGQRLGVNPDEILAFEDSGAGVTAAKAAGLWCAAVPTPSTLGHDFRAADFIVKDLAATPLAELFMNVLRAGRRGDSRPPNGV